MCWDGDVCLNFQKPVRSEEHTSELQSRPHLVCRLVLEKKKEGYNVLFPIGWDAFGLPAENYAIKHKIHHRVAVQENMRIFKEQLKMLGFSFDWSREINT